MSSPPKVKAETRAGHPPAVKAGGMRIVQKHPHAPDTKEDKDKEDTEWESGTRRWLFLRQNIEDYSEDCFEISKEKTGHKIVCSTQTNGVYFWCNCKG